MRHDEAVEPASALLGTLRDRQEGVWQWLVR